MSEVHIGYTIQKDEAVIWISGEIRLFFCNTLELAFEQMATKRSDQRMVIDLSHAVYIDSTIFGIIASHCQNERKKTHEMPMLYYGNSDIKKQLVVLGINQLCLLRKGPSPYCKAHQALEDLNHNSSIQSVVVQTQSKTKD